MKVMLISVASSVFAFTAFRLYEITLSSTVEEYFLIGVAMLRETASAGGTKIPLSEVIVELTKLLQGGLRFRRLTVLVKVRSKIQC